VSAELVLKRNSGTVGHLRYRLPSHAKWMDKSYVLFLRTLLSTSNHAGRLVGAACSSLSFSLGIRRWTKARRPFLRSLRVCQFFR
jgi:hypothetical protein